MTSVMDRFLAGGAPQAPRFMHDLVDRAASMLRATRMPVDGIQFSWWADGEDLHYLARMDWPVGADAPNVLVFDGRSGDFVCRSLPGRPFELDTAPGAWSLDALAGFVPEGNTWGAIATLVAIAGSVGQLAQRRVDEQPARTDRSQTAVSHAH